MPQTISTQLVINAVDSKETFEEMKSQGLVNPNELYLVAENLSVEYFTATIPHAAASWSSAGGVYYTTVSVSGLRVTDNPIIDVLADAENPNVMQAIEDWGLCIVALSNAANTLALMFKDIPSVDIPIKILCIRK